MNKWLDEENLGFYLEKIFNTTFIRDKQIPFINEKFRPDYRNEELKIIVEYDGPRHYTEAKRIKQDEIRDEKLRLIGYTVVRVPYFVQIETRTVKHLFDINKEIPLTYPHGFNEDGVVLPADFCQLGVKRFEKDLEKFTYLKDEIVSTLEEKIKKLNYIECVLPESLYYIVGEYSDEGNKEITKPVVKKQEKDTSIQCQVCKKTLTGIKGLKKHLTMSHPDLDRKQYYNDYLKPSDEDIYCPYCGEEKAFNHNVMYYWNTCGKDECMNEDNSRKVKEHHNNYTREDWEEILEKRKQTNREKYGTDWVMQSEEVKERRRQNYLETYGVENNSQTFEWKEKVVGKKRPYYGKGKT